MNLKEYNLAHKKMELEIQESRKKFKEAGCLYLKANKNIPKSTAVRKVNESDFVGVTTGEYKLESHTGAIWCEVAFGSKKDYFDQSILEAL